MKPLSESRVFSWLVIVFLVGCCVFVSSRAYATDWGECKHPRFVEKGCEVPGPQGPPGEQGPPGPQGPPGRDGIDGKDGEIPTEWITNVHNLYDQSRDAAAAAAAMQVHLPQEQISGVTFSMAHLNGVTGVGVGYARMLENDRAVTFSVGRAGGETAFRGSYSFEFGGTRKIEIPMAEIVEPEYVTEPELEERAQAFSVQQQNQDEQLDDVQMAQVDIENRVDALERELRKPKPVVIKKERFTPEQRAAVYDLFMEKGDE